MRKVLTVAGVLLISALVLTTCDGGGPGNEVSASIGPDGGTITSSDGKLTLTFPAGALGEETTIVIRVLDPDNLPPEFADLGGDLAYELLPDGLEFAVPVTATVPLDDPPVQPDGSLSTQFALLLTSIDGVIVPLDNQLVLANAETNTATVTGELSHFSLLERITTSLEVTLFRVPECVAVGEPFIIIVELINPNPGFINILSVEYNDFSDIPPINIIDEKKGDLINETADEIAPEKQSFFKTLEYTCDPRGTGELTVFLTFFFDINSDFAKKTNTMVSVTGHTEIVTCPCPPDVQPPPPSPPPPSVEPACATIAGDYMLMTENTVDPERLIGRLIPDPCKDSIITLMCEQGDLLYINGPTVARTLGPAMQINGGVSFDTRGHLFFGDQGFTTGWEGVVIDGCFEATYMVDPREGQPTEVWCVGTRLGFGGDCAGIYMEGN